MTASEEAQSEDLVEEVKDDEAGADHGRTLSQDEIDNLLGFESDGEGDDGKTGIQAILDKSMLAYERLPMLEVIFDRFVRLISTSLRNFTSDNVDVDIHSITSIRFGDYVNSIPMPALLTVFKAIEWDNYGLITIDGSLVYSMVDVLFGGRRSTRPIRIEGRPYTTIEQGIVKYLSELMLSDMGAAFDPLSPATFNFERLETNPRFTTIARPADAAIILQLRVDMEERGGNVEILFPYVTLEPIRDLLTQVFLGEKFGKDSVWEKHLGSEVYSTDVDMEALLAKKTTVLGDIAELKVGSTLLMDTSPHDNIVLRCYDVDMFSATVGRVEDSIAVQIEEILNKKMRSIIGGG